MSVLLQLARESIQEVYEAARTIDKSALLDEHPLLNERIKTTVNIYLDDELRGTYSSHVAKKSLLDDIIINAKKAVFEDRTKGPLTTAEYLGCEVELILYTPSGVLKERDSSILSKNKNSLINQGIEESLS